MKNKNKKILSDYPIKKIGSLLGGKFTWNSLFSNRIRRKRRRRAVHMTVVSSLLASTGLITDSWSLYSSENYLNVKKVTIKNNLISR